jgi:hypothetical protein
MPRGTAWTYDETRKLFRLRDVLELEWKDIALKIGRSEAACWNHYYNEGGSRHGSYSVRKNPSEEALADAARRAQARERQSLTEQFFGDPPKGYSALDRKQQATAQRSPVVTLPSNEAGLVP